MRQAPWVGHHGPRVLTHTARRGPLGIDRMSHHVLDPLEEGWHEGGWVGVQAHGGMAICKTHGPCPYVSVSTFIPHVHRP